MKADFEMGGGWGDTIEWLDPKTFNHRPFYYGSKFKCYGFKSRKPVIGQTLKAEFEKSWVLFKFVEIENISNPSDMFFAEVTPIKRICKDSGLQTPDSLYLTARIKAAEGCSMWWTPGVIIGLRNEPVPARKSRILPWLVEICPWFNWGCISLDQQSLKKTFSPNAEI